MSSRSPVIGNQPHRIGEPCRPAFSVSSRQTMTRDACVNMSCSPLQHSAEQATPRPPSLACVGYASREVYAINCLTLRRARLGNLALGRNTAMLQLVPRACCRPPHVLHAAYSSTRLSSMLEIYRNVRIHQPSSPLAKNPIFPSCMVCFHGKASF